MKDICPILSDPLIAKEFNELKQAVGEKAAYHIWSLNNGNGIDKAPNGEPSILFLSLLQLTNGNRIKAILLKSNVYRPSFIEWFGDWIEDPEHSSKVVDENGEPMIVYHGGAKDILEFKSGGETTGNRYYVDKKTGEKIPSDSLNTIFFSSNRYVGVSYADLYGINYFLKLRGKIESLISTNYNGVGGYSKEIFKTFNDFIDTLDKLKELNPRYEKFKNYLLQIKQKGERLKPNEVEAFRQMLIESREKVRNFSEEWLMNRSEWDFVLNESYDILKKYSTEEGVLKLINGEIPDSLLKEYEIFKLIEKDRETNGLSKIANYETVNLPYISLDSTFEVFQYDGLDLYIGGKKVSEYSNAELLNLLNDAKQLNRDSVNDYHDEKISTVRTKSLLYPVFLNIKNPFIHDYKGTQMGYGYRWSLKYSFGYVAARQVRKAKLDGNDGVVYLNLYDPYLADNYGAFSSNQIKSIYNRGTFSKENGNIYLNLKNVIRNIKTPNDVKTVLNKISSLYFSFHNYDKKLYTTQSAQNKLYEDQLKMLEDAFGLPRNSIYLTKRGIVKFNDQLINENFDLIKNDIQPSKITDAYDKIKLISFMMQKFPLIKGIKLVSSSKFNGMFKDGYVYMNVNASLDIAAEECLHPFVEALFVENPELFELLWKEACKDFKELRAQIAITYNDKKGFTKQDRRKELVTQALARHFAEVYEEANDPRKESKSVWKKALDWILNKLGLSGVKDLPKDLTFRQLSEAIFKANNISISDDYFVDPKYHLAEDEDSEPIIEDFESYLEKRDEYDKELDQLIEDDESLREYLQLEEEAYVKNRVTDFIDNNTDEDGTRVVPLLEDIEQERINARRYFYRNKIENYIADLHDYLYSYLANKNKMNVVNEMVKGSVIGTSIGFGTAFLTGGSSILIGGTIGAIVGTLRAISNNHNVRTTLDDEALLDRIYNLISQDKPELAKLGLLLFRNSLLGVRPEHNIRTIVEQYIYAYQDSNVIQNALKVLNAGRNIDTPKLVLELADGISDRFLNSDRKQRNIKHLENFNDVRNLIWNKIRNFFRKPINEENKESLYKERRRVFADLQACIAANEELDKCSDEELIFNLSKWTISGEELTVDENKTLKAILKGIKSRIKSMQSVSNGVNDPEELQRLIEWRDEILAILKEEDSDEKVLKLQEQISKFLNIGIVELAKIARLLNEMSNSPIDKTKYKDLMRIKTDIVGFYKNINSLYIQQYAQSTDSPLFKEGGEHYNDIKLIRDTIVSLAVVYDKLLLRYTDYLIDTVADDYVDIGDKERFKLNAKMWLRNSIDGGTLSFFENFTNSAATSASPIVRIVDMYIREANLATRQETFERGLKLLLLYDKCEPLLNKILPSNFMRYFMEMDDEGKPTGNLINPFNIGLFELRKRAIIKKLDDKYEVKYDKDTNKRIFKDHETSIKYYDEYDEELDKIGAVRRFKKEYYKAKRYMLSEDAIARLDEINSQIQRIKQKAIENIEVDGRIILIVNQTKLSPIEKRELKILNEIKSLLSSEYRIIKDDSGNIVLFEQKTGVELLIAKELLEFSNFLQSHSSETKADKELYQSVKQQLIDKYGEDSEEVKQFVRDYSRRDATDDFYKMLTSESIELSEEVLNLKNRKRLILKTILIVSGLYRNKYDFRKLNNEALEELRRIDEELDEKTQHTLHTDEYIQWSRENVSNINLGITGDSKSFLDSEYNKITRLYPGNDSKLDELYYDKYFYVNKKGERIPLSIFFAVTPLYESYIDEEKPTGMFLYSENFLKDSRYDESNRASIQFDKEMYRNKDYEEKVGKFIDKDGKPKNAIAEFYLELLKTLNDAWSKIPNIERANPYQLPQRRDRSSHLVTRKGLINNIKAVLSNTFTINENDLLFNEEFSQRPDGTIVETIPLRWIRPLKDPSTISTDILGSIVDFYEMATNFQAKLGISAIAEALRLLTMGGIQQERETDQSKRIATQESMFIYGRMVSGFGSKVKLSRVERALAKLLQNLRGAVFYKLMAHNWMTVMKNLIDSSCSLYAEIAGGKYFTVGMFWDSVKDMGIELFKGNAFNVGKTLTNGFTSCAMQYNGVSGSIHELFSNRNETRLRRILSLHFDTGEYTLVDYTFKGLITNMVYKSYKYIQNPQTLQYEFMNIDKVKYIYSQAGLSKLAAVDAFNKSKITLKDAYVPTNGTLILKDEYKNVVKPSITDFNRKSSLKLELRIQGIIKERSGVINGMLDDMDRGKLHQNYVGALIMQMRGWMIAQFSDYTKRGHDFDKISDNEQLTKQSLYEFIKAKTFGAEGQILEQSRDYAGQFNFTSGTVDVGIWRNLVKSYWNYTKAGAELSKYINNNKVSDQELYAVKRMNATIFGFLFTVAMTVGLGIASTMYGGDDPEKIKETNPSKYYSWLALYFAYGSFMSSINERSSQLWYPGFVSTVSDIWNSPTVAKSYIDDAHYMWDFGKDLVQYADYWITDGQESEYEIFDKVKGNTSFRGMSKFKSDFLRATSVTPGLNKYGIANVYKNTTKTGITQKYNYYYQKVFPTEFAVESGYWTLDKLDIYHKPEKTKQPKIINPRQSTRTSSRKSTRKSTR